MSCFVLQDDQNAPDDDSVPTGIPRTVRLDDRLRSLFKTGRETMEQVLRVDLILILILCPKLSYIIMPTRIKRREKKEKLEKILTSEWIKTHSRDSLSAVRN